MSLELGAIVDGTVVKIMPYGAFVDLENGGSGMVHISEVASGYIKEISEKLTIGDKVKVKVIGVNPQGKVSLSIRAAQADTAQQPKGDERGGSPHTRPRPQRKPNTQEASNSADPFEDMISRFKRSSDEKLSDFRRASELRRGVNRRGGRSH